MAAFFKNQSYPFLPAQAVPYQDTKLSKLRMDWISATPPVPSNHVPLGSKQPAQT